MSEETRVQIEARKREHLDLSLRPEVQGNGAGLEGIHLPYDALFECKAVDTRSRMGKIGLSFPLMIGAMTGGTCFAAAFNTVLRRYAAEHDIALCLGSMRAALLDDSLLETYGSGDLEALFANIGISELFVYPSEKIAETARRMGASGLFIHLNGLQEYVQNEGNRDYGCALDDLRRFVDSFPMPCFIKEVGSGLGGRCACRLALLNIAGAESASRGGTSWVKLEGMRRKKAISAVNMAALDQVGYGLAQSIRDLRAALGARTVIASGGIRNSLDIVKALALGADVVAMAQPVYAAYHDSGASGMRDFLDETIDIAKLIWRSTGAADIGQLKACLA
ncbi:MAG: alpha-hydroxy-acid oxidizing protein [Proteobacteria bacterium]|nr:alpha-hydroxy-acid oxidizing protein [Pseudomonadota bacterium]